MILKIKHFNKYLSSVLSKDSLSFNNLCLALTPQLFQALEKLGFWRWGNLHCNKQQQNFLGVIVNRSSHFSLILKEVRTMQVSLQIKSLWNQHYGHATAFRSYIGEAGAFLHCD